jgi:ribosomal protein L11 methyltransferase
VNALLSEGLIASGGLAVEENGEWLGTWIADADGRTPPDQFVEAVRDQLEQLTAGAPFDITWEWKPNDDWISLWRKGLAPRRVGRRLWITPTWIRPESGRDDIVIQIDPQMAFGTGEHASTRGVLRLLEDAVRPGARVLDAGTGSGVLAIAAVHLGAAAVDAVDLDPDAIMNARENVALNNCADRIRLTVAKVDDAFLAASAGPWDVIAANILSTVIKPLLHTFRQHLRPGGAILVGGILESEADDVIDAARAAGLTVVADDREEGWWAARLVPAGTTGTTVASPATAA